MSETKHTPQPAETPIGKALVLRTCAEDMSSHGGFKWPTSGRVEAPDWSPKKACGQGLHGLLWGDGDGSLLSWEETAKWLVVEVEADRVVDLGRKVKFPSGEVVFCGDRNGATEYLSARAPGRAIVGGTATAGDYGTATAGYYGTATAGDYGTATAGDYGTATAGYYGTATAGYYGTATAGDDGSLILRWWDGKRCRIATFYVGEDGIEPNQPYRVDDQGRAVKVSKATGRTP